ncbi:sensor histidine kinase [Nocardia sp. NPDC004123]
MHWSAPLSEPLLNKVHAVVETATGEAASMGKTANHIAEAWDQRREALAAQRSRQTPPPAYDSSERRAGQEISRGIHPATLSRGGLVPALKTLARRCSVPVYLDLVIERRLPEPVEVGAYYVVAEALTNTTKHAQASIVNVHAETDDANLCLLVRDDGRGGADPREGSGLMGLIDRVETLGGHLEIVSRPESGTALHISMPA